MFELHGTIVEGVRIARSMKESIRGALQSRNPVPSVGVVVCAHDLATEKFITVKEKTAAELGIPLTLYRLSPQVTTEGLCAAVHEATTKHDGIVVQFPLPPHVDADAVRNVIPVGKDLDVISDQAFTLFKEGKSTVLPPVVGALDVIVGTYQVSLKDRCVVVVGEGRLVGIPAKIWAQQQGAEVVSANARTPDLSGLTSKAEALILGAGVPSLITPDMVREGVIVLDAGTSEAQGKLAGDADPSIATKASLFTPVPGGIGPITISVLFRNLITLSGGVPLDGVRGTW